jgi:hypothetical protein
MDILSINYICLSRSCCKKCNYTDPLAEMKPVAHDLAAGARQLESLARMACLILEISIYKKLSTLSSIE